MKNFAAAFAVAVVALVFTNTADARPAYKTKFVALYGAKNAAAKKAGCKACHPTKSKKDRNDYGYALSKLVNAKDFKGAKAKSEESQKKLAAAFKKLETSKNAEGKTFGELLKAGKLPGTDKAYKPKKKD